MIGTASRRIHWARPVRRVFSAGGTESVYQIWMPHKGICSRSLGFSGSDATRSAKLIPDQLPRAANRVVDCSGDSVASIGQIDLLKSRGQPDGGADPTARGLPAVVPGRTHQGEAGRERSSARNDGDPAERLCGMGTNAGRGRRADQGRRRPERIFPVADPDQLLRARGQTTSRDSVPSSPS